MLFDFSRGCGGETLNRDVAAAYGTRKRRMLLFVGSGVYVLRLLSGDERYVNVSMSVHPVFDICLSCGQDPQAVDGDRYQNPIDRMGLSQERNRRVVLTHDGGLSRLVGVVLSMLE